MSMKVTAKDLKSMKDVEVIDVVNEKDSYIITVSTSESLVDSIHYNEHDYEFEATVNSVFNVEIDKNSLTESSLELPAREFEFLTIDSLTRILTTHDESFYDELNYALAESIKKRESSSFVYHFDFEEEAD